MQPGHANRISRRHFLRVGAGAVSLTSLPGVLRAGDSKGDFGGFIVGVLENVVGAILGTELKLTVALVLIIGVLVIRPSGLFGKVHVTRV